jgi:hypothetical protein
MSKTLLALLAATVSVAPLAGAQDKAPTAKAPGEITMTGCVSAKPDANGQYTFAGADGISRYQLKGRRLSRFAGQRVEVVGGTSGNGLSVRGGLVGPMAGARGVALDPAQESILRQPGGGGAGIGPAFPEFKVSKVRTVEGACEEAGSR